MQHTLAKRESPDVGADALQERIDTFVLEALPVAATGLGLLFAVYAASHPRVLPSPIGPVMAVVAAVTALGLLGLAAWLRRVQPPARWAQPLAALLLAGPLVNSLLHLQLTGDPEQTTNLMLVAVGAALLLVSPWWFWPALATTAGGWLAVALVAPASGEWVHFGFALLATLVLATILHVAWTRALLRLERLRLADAARQDQLAAALTASEAARRSVEASSRELAALVEAVQRSEERFRRFTDLEGIAVHEGGIIVEANDRLARMLGAPLAGVVGRSLLELVAPESRPALQTFLDAPQPATCEVLGRRADGAPFPLELSGKAVPYDGRMARVAVFRDVSERRHAEEALRESEARLRQLADAMPHIVWSAGPDGHVDYYNARWYELIGIPESEAPRDLWRTLCHADDVERVVAAWRAAVQSGHRFEAEYRVLDARTGIYRWHLARVLPVRDARGRVVRWFGSATDVDEATRAREALEEADRRKDHFLAVLGHELRNPLTSIRLALEVLRRVRGDDARAEHARAVIDRQARHMTRLIDDLLDVSRVTRGKIALRPEPLDLADVVRATVEDHRAGLAARGVTLALQVDDEPVHVRGDATRLSQVLGNLLSNATKFVGDGGHVTVDLHRTDDGRTAVLAVRDTGIGIAAAMLPRIFDAFTQADGEAGRSHGGLGLGLALAHALVELHGGSIHAESEGPGRGATFVVHLPLADAEAVAPSRAPRPVPSVPRRVLVIEDNADAAESLATLLGLSGHEVVVAPTGAAGIGLAVGFRPDVVLCDIGLPGDVDGYEVARALRADPRTRALYLVALTGYGQAEDRRRAREAGFDLHLTKPVEAAQLERVLAGLGAAAVPAGRGATGR